MDAQETLPLETPRPAVDIDYLTKAKRTVGAVLYYQAELAGLDPKQVYISLDMQKSVWSGITSDQRSFPIRGECADFQKFSDMTGNDSLLLWLCHIRGYDPRSLRPYRSEVEAENERLRAEVQEKERELETIKNFLRETGK